MCACRVTNGQIDAFEHEDPSMIDKSKVDQGFLLSCIVKVKKAGATIAINQEDEYHKA
jgi:ferredoxin